MLSRLDSSMAVQDLQSVSIDGTFLILSTSLLLGLFGHRLTSGRARIDTMSDKEFWVDGYGR